MAPQQLPTATAVSGALGADFARAGWEIEDVVVEPGAPGRPARIIIVVDGEHAPDLDDLAELSRTASALLDAADATADAPPYLLEVTSPGVDRPLSTERHFRRARGRRAAVTLRDGSTVTGRIGAQADGMVTLVVADRRGVLSTREIALADVGRAVVQVEFSAPARRELELAGMTAGPGEEADR